jgi:hypothetical protein
MNPAWYFILGPLALLCLGLLVCKYGQAIDEWKNKDDPLLFIMTVVATLGYSSLFYGLYLLLSTKL